MSGQTTNPVYKFAETQRRAMPAAQIQNVVPKNSLFNATNLVAEVRSIKQTQQEIHQKLSILMDVCNKIGDSVTDVKDKLSQYDIDGDDVSNAEESDTDEVNESTDECETKQYGENIDEMEEDECHDDSTKSLEVSMAVDTDNNNDTEKNIDHKTKRKYTRRKK